MRAGSGERRSSSPTKRGSSAAERIREKDRKRRAGWRRRERGLPFNFFHHSFVLVDILYAFPIFTLAFRPQQSQSGGLRPGAVFKRWMGFCVGYLHLGLNGINILLIYLKLIIDYHFHIWFVEAVFRHQILHHCYKINAIILGVLNSYNQFLNFFDFTNGS